MLITYNDVYYVTDSRSGIPKYKIMVNPGITHIGYYELMQYDLNIRNYKEIEHSHVTDLSYTKKKGLCVEDKLVVMDAMKHGTKVEKTVNMMMIQRKDIPESPLRISLTNKVSQCYCNLLFILLFL